MLKSIKSIIFDLGGVMVDLDKEKCIQSFTEIGFAEAANLIDFYHPADFFNRLERGEIDTNQLCDIIREKANCYISNEDICRAYSDFLVGIPIHKLKLLEKLREKGYKIYALSNINEIVMPKVYQFFEADGKNCDFYFDKMYLSFEMRSLKPDREIFEKLIADSGVIPSETLFIDDGERNVLMGNEMGFNTYMPAARENFDHIFEEI